MELFPPSVTSHVLSERRAGTAFPGADEMNKALVKMEGIRSVFGLQLISKVSRQIIFPTTTKLHVFLHFLNIASVLHFFVQINTDPLQAPRGRRMWAPVT